MIPSKQPTSQPTEQGIERMKNKLTLPDFLIIPSVLLKDKEIKPLDCFVFGVVYWFKRLKLEKCTLGNKALAELLGSTPGSCANSVSNLGKRGAVKVVMDENNHRVEIIPLISFKKSSEGGSFKSEGGVHLKVKHNKIIKNNTNVDEKIKIDFYAKELAKILKDKKSLSFYKLACQKHDPLRLLQKAIEIISDGGARNPGAVFTDWLKKK